MVDLPEFSSSLRKRKKHHLQIERNGAKLIQLLWHSLGSQERRDVEFLQLLTRCSWVTSNEATGRLRRNEYLSDWLGLTPRKTSDDILAEALSRKLGTRASAIKRCLAEPGGISNYYGPLRPRLLKAIKGHATEIAKIFEIAADVSNDGRSKVRRVYSRVSALPSFTAPNGGKARVINGLTAVLACLEPNGLLPIMNARTTSLLKVVGHHADVDGADALYRLIGQKGINDAFDLDIYAQSLTKRQIKANRRVKSAGQEHKTRQLGFKSEQQHFAQLVRQQIEIGKKHNTLTNEFIRAIEWRFERHRHSEAHYDIAIRNWRSGRTLLIEAKPETQGPVGRTQLRQAIGQLFDYRRMYFSDSIDQVDLAVLTASKPSADVEALLKSLTIKCLFFHDKILHGLD